MATNAFQSGFDMKQQQNDVAPKQTSGSAFQQGFSAGQNKNLKRKTSKATNTLKKAQDAGGAGLQTTQQAVKAVIPMLKKGGRITKTGLAIVHRGELVVPAKQSRKRSSGKASRKRTSIKP
jgi:hypothetical protein